MTAYRERHLAGVYNPKTKTKTKTKTKRTTTRANSTKSK